LILYSVIDDIGGRVLGGIQFVQSLQGKDARLAMCMQAAPLERVQLS
jgi:hypothetical protein